jgi:Ca2+-binding RTX toxin-like protein
LDNPYVDADGDPTISSTQVIVRWDYAGQDRTVFNGSFDIDYSGDEPDVVGGTISGADEYVDNVRQYTVSNMNYPVLNYISYASSRDARGFLTDVLKYSDTITGSSGSDYLESFAGNDSLTGGSGGNDTLVGGTGNDTMDGGVGTDSLIGGAGNDTYKVEVSGDKVVEAASQGSDTVQSSASSYTLSANVEKLILTGTAAKGTGNALPNTLTGNNAANSLTGNNGNDTLTGSGGNDSLIGGGGADSLDGGAGADLLRGGTGNDILTGGGGADKFRFDSALTSNIDKITDFSAVDDTIQLDNAIFTVLTATGTLTAGKFVEEASAIAHDGNDYILYDTTTGKLYYDADGNGIGAKVQFATLWDSPTTHPTASEISASDFSVI